MSGMLQHFSGSPVAIERLGLSLPTQDSSELMLARTTYSLSRERKPTELLGYETCFCFGGLSLVWEDDMQIGVDCNLAVGTQRVFVLGTDEIERMAVQFMLHDEYETHELASVQAAIAKSQEWPPDLVILGEALLQEEGLGMDQFRQQFPTARVLLITDASEAEQDAAVMSDGTVLLHKPLRIENLRAKVISALRET